MNTIKISDQADVSRVLADAMERSHLTTVKAGKVLGYDQSSISKMKSGNMKLKIEDFPRLMKELKPGEAALLSFNFASEITGHIIPSTVSGELIRVDPYDLTGRVEDEIKQMIIAFNDAADELRSMPSVVTDRRDVVEAFKQAYDVFKFLTNFFASLYSTYPDENWQEMAYKRDRQVNKFPQRAI
ncbi:hypothetical protein [Lentilactobacillus kribbianus]|uniref:hypothetical protein n=1 Tax=Lentilactobacillus kribbianus TaxID=2729622 RepID=UPI001553C80A|nr:hypothetical protein [Lentilactobacillus kribbianus]